jgi:hypothetical protein
MWHVVIIWMNDAWRDGHVMRAWRTLRSTRPSKRLMNWVPTKGQITLPSLCLSSSSVFIYRTSSVSLMLLKGPRRTLKQMLPQSWDVFAAGLKQIIISWIVSHIRLISSYHYHSVSYSPTALQNPNIRSFSRTQKKTVKAQTLTATTTGWHYCQPGRVLTRSR